MINKQKIKLNDQGISLIEIIVVIAIISIIGGIAFLSTSVATDKHVSSCAERISSSLEQTRSLALGKQSGNVKVWKETGGSVFCQMVIDGNDYGDTVAIGHSGLTVKVQYYQKYENAHSVSNVMLDEDTLGSSGINISFSRSNGSINNISDIAPANTSVLVFEVTNTRRTVNVVIDVYTGRVYTESVD